MKLIYALLIMVFFVALPETMAKDKKEEEKEGGIKVRLGKDIKREYKDVVKDKYAYGPKQEYDKKTKETRVWLPYGDNKALYAHVKGILIDPSPENGMAKFHCCDASSDGILAYKIEFDKPISEFTFKYGKVEYGLEKGTVAGIEYSTNGKSWKTIKEVEGAGPKDVQTINNFVENFKAEKLKTKTLYIRFYSRSKKEPEKPWGPGRWLQLWLAGDPNWGDIQTTFFIHQPQIWVKKAY